MLQKPDDLPSLQIASRMALGFACSFGPLNRQHLNGCVQADALIEPCVFSDNEFKNRVDESLAR
jgi:hypothetical protein